MLIGGGNVGYQGVGVCVVCIVLDCIELFIVVVLYVCGNVVYCQWCDVGWIELLYVSIDVGEEGGVLVRWECGLGWGGGVEFDEGVGYGRFFLRLMRLLVSGWYYWSECMVCLWMQVLVLLGCCCCYCVYSLCSYCG